MSQDTGEQMRALGVTGLNVGIRVSGLSPTLAAMERPVGQPTAHRPYIVVQGWSARIQGLQDG